MPKFRGIRLSWLLWLIALVAMFLGGVRYGEWRKTPVYRSIVITIPGPAGTQETKIQTFDVKTSEGQVAYKRAVAAARKSGLHFEAE